MMRNSTAITASAMLVICAGCKSVEMGQPLALSPLGDGVRLARPAPAGASGGASAAATTLAQQHAATATPGAQPSAPRQQLARPARQAPRLRQQPPAAAPASQAPRPDLAPTVRRASRSKSSPEVGWQTLALTPQQRPIEVARFGNGSEQVLLVGPLGGGEPEAVALADSLAADLLRRESELGSVTVTVVRDANPDGSARGTVGNSRHVQLDRNFASRDWRRVESVARTVSGETAQSEAETGALAELIEQLRPRRLVQLKSRAPLATVHSAGPAEPLARQLSEQYGLRRVLPAPATVTGSLASFAGDDRQIPTIVLNVPARRSPMENWNLLSGALQLALGLNEKGHTARAEAPDAVPVGPPTESGPVQADWRQATPPERLRPETDVDAQGEDHGASQPAPPAAAPSTNAPDKTPRRDPPFRDAPIRLPSFHRAEPSPDAGKPRPLPQPPIPFYPRTGER